jgi:hypothetical protein
MVQIRNAYKILVGETEGKKTLGRHRHRWEYNIRMNLKKIGWEEVDCIRLAHGRD